eukprot:5609853-Amphidinium_carterae.1
MTRAPEGPEAPLWPDESGNFVAKTAVINTVRALASLACPGTDTTGMTGHTFRCTGAQLMARA